ncbi:MAG: acetate--CoA ligase family protein [Deltaproteobacteria bacterium]|nr:acetate--CoA ligase family protein [Deltaproteobacteria bacterium]
MATDTLMELGGELARLSDQSINELNSFLPTFWSRANPIDVLGDADHNRYLKAVKVCLTDPNVDGVLVIYTPQAICPPDRLADSVVEMAKETWKPILVTLVGGEYVQKGREILLNHKIPEYETPEDAVKTYLLMYKYYKNLALLYETPTELPLTESPPKNHLKAFIKRVAKEERAILSEEESKNYLSNYGLPVIEATMVQSLEGAIKTADRIKYPVVIKIVSPDISHKSDVGGVRTGIRTAEERRIRRTGA